MPLTKYGFEIDNSVIATNITRLTNQLWKLIPMRENDEPWDKQLNTVILEIAGLNEIFVQNPRFLQLLSKLEGLFLFEDTDFSLYRKTVFEAINLLQEIKKSERK